ncbi:MAG TPA: hypothetical protein DD490_03745, partial [Acidobacteria bacterium]|nr:hypothetical protein [Acidobacteriota bacterium]
IRAHRVAVQQQVQIQRARAIALRRAALASLPALEALGTGREVARVRWRLGVALTSTGALREALGHLETAAATFRRLGDGVGEARVSNSLGAVWRYLGEPGRARAAYERALTLYRTADVLNGEASALNNLGLVDESTGALQQALTRYEEALALWRRFGDRGAEAATLQNLGSLYVQIGHDAEGLALLRRALVLAAKEPAASNEPARTSILISLGWAEALTGHPDQALERYREALTLARSTGDQLAEAAILDRQGSALKALGRFAEAEASYLRSLEISHGGTGGEGSPRNEGPTLANLGQLHLETGGTAGLDRAQGELERALALLQAAGDPSSEAVVRVALSRIERRRGAFEPARRQIDRALHRLEELRAGLRGPASRGIFQATRYDAWEELVTLLLAQGHASEALEVAERARARNLLDQIRDTTSPSPGGPATLTARQIQALADPETLLVVFFLAEPASVAWTIDRDSLVVHTLPGRATLETLARRVAAAVPKSHEIAVHAAATRALRDLGTALLAPLATRLESHRRLVVLPDGALHLVPFCALPIGSSPSPLLLTHEIVLLPSATVLAEQRRRLAGRAPAPGTVAVLADPLFTAPGAAEERGDPALGFGPLPRLPFTADEARAIERLVPADRRLVALGAAASRDLVMSGALRRYRILHFATHGLLHPVLPERSGLVLTLFDAQGHPSNGFLAAPDVAGLDLPADLAVLSACQTGLGR